MKAHLEEKGINVGCDHVRFFRSYEGSPWHAQFVDGGPSGHGESWRGAAKDMVKRMRRWADELEKSL